LSDRRRRADALAAEADGFRAGGLEGLRADSRAPPDDGAGRLRIAAPR
jgi:hypothetical protein